MLTIRKSIFALALAALVGTQVSAGVIRGQIAGGEGSSTVVWVEGLSGEVPEKDTPITHVSGGAFEPGFSIGYVGREFVLRNEDKVLHNTHLYMKLAYQKDISGRPLQLGSTVYNVALPRSGQEVRKPINPYHRYRDATGFIEIVCNAHPNERAFLLVVDHPYITVAAEDGSFEISGVPAGDHEIRYWHAGSVKKWGSVDTRERTEASISIELE
jgi:hypothetical protein